MRRAQRRLSLGVLLATTGIVGPAWGQDTVEDEIVITPCWIVDSEADLTSPAYGQCRPGDEVVVTGERVGAAAIDELTAPASILTETDLRQRDQGTLADTLRAVPGLAVSQSGSALGLTQLRLRGAEANQIVVLIDGVEVANPADGAFDFGGLRAEDVLRVEVLRGEQSALYGADAIGGVINIITRATSARRGWQASVEAGSDDTLEGQAGAVVPLGQASLSVNGSAFTTDGYDISGRDGEADGGSSRAISLGLNSGSIGMFDLSARYGVTLRDNDFDEDSDFDGRLDDTDSEVRVRTETARLEARGEVAGMFDVLGAVSRVKTDTDTRAGFPTDTTGIREQASLAVEHEANAHNITLLGEYEKEEYAFAGDPDTPSNDSWGVAGDYRYHNDRLTLTASARYDANDLFDDSLTWRAGVGYETGVFGRVTASVGTGVKNPTLIELFGFFPESRFTGNPDLQPEESLGFNVGWSLGLERGRIAANYFRSELSDEIVTLFNPDFTTSVANLATDSTREGLEIEGRYGFGDIDLSGSISFLDSEQDGTPEVRRPDILASATATWQASDDLSLTLFADHTGSQFDTDFATFTVVELDAFTLLGARASLDLSDRWSVYIRGENLLDEDYEEIVGFRAPGARLFGGLRARY